MYSSHLVGYGESGDMGRQIFVSELNDTSITLYKGLIVTYRAPVRNNGKTGNEEKSPIYIADVTKIMSQEPE